MRTETVQRNQIGGWSFSLLIHGLLLSALWPVFHHLPVPLQPEPFRWNVTLVELLPQNVVTNPTNDSSLMSGASEMVESAMQHSAPLPQKFSSVPVPPTPAATKTIRPAREFTPETAIPETTKPAASEPVSSPPSPHTVDTTPAIREDLPVAKVAAEQPQPTTAATPIPAEPSVPSTTTRGQQDSLPSAPPVTDVAMAPVQPRDVSTQPLAPVSSFDPSQASVPPAPVASAAVNQSSAPRADYSWLQRAVSRRLEELKRSSRPSLDDAARLKVLVKAVVSNTGELLEAEIVNSSGLARIDQEAMTLVERAFPMPLDEVIDRPQIVMRIPITYSRN